MGNSPTNASESQLEVKIRNGLERKSLVEALEGRGLRLTMQRRVLIEELQNAEGHLDAKELLKRANRRDARVNRATVYRTLDLLKRLGLIDELDLMHVNGEKHYYEVRTHRDHVHLTCFQCGKVQEFTSPLYEDLRKEIQDSCGFAIEVVRLEVGGRCRDCADKVRKSKQN